MAKDSDPALKEFCPCCGFEMYSDRPEVHDYSCVWYEEPKEPENG